jgi:hypothetical protein
LMNQLLTRGGDAVHPATMAKNKTICQTFYIPVLRAGRYITLISLTVSLLAGLYFLSIVETGGVKRQKLV